MRKEVFVFSILILVISGCFSDPSHHLTIPEGNYDKEIIGTFKIIKSPTLAIPTVFRGKTLYIEKSDKDLLIRGENGSTMKIKRGGDGFYFYEEFNPSGAIILPGIARNWNEGKLYWENDKIVVNGFMLEKGLMLYFIPFKDVVPWTVVISQ